MSSDQFREELSVLRSILRKRHPTSERPITEEELEEARGALDGDPPSPASDVDVEAVRELFSSAASLEDSAATGTWLAAPLLGLAGGASPLPPSLLGAIGQRAAACSGTKKAVFIETFDEGRMARIVPAGASRAEMIRLPADALVRIHESWRGGGQFPEERAAVVAAAKRFMAPLRSALSAELILFSFAAGSPVFDLEYAWAMADGIKNLLARRPRILQAEGSATSIACAMTSAAVSSLGSAALIPCVKLPASPTAGMAAWKAAGRRRRAREWYATTGNIIHAAVSAWIASGRALARREQLTDALQQRQIVLLAGELLTAKTAWPGWGDRDDGCALLDLAVCGKRDEPAPWRDARTRAVLEPHRLISPREAWLRVLELVTASAARVMWPAYPGHIGPQVPYEAAVRLARVTVWLAPSALNRAGPMYATE